MRIPLPCGDSSVVCSRVGDLYAEDAETFCLDMGVQQARGEGWCATGAADRELRGKLVQLIATPTDAERNATSAYGGASSSAQAKLFAELSQLWEAIVSLPKYLKAPRRLLQRLKALDDTTIYAATFAVFLSIPINFALRKFVLNRRGRENDDA